MLAKDGGAEITCEFCRKTYNMGADELDGLIALSSEQSGS
jgi:redox-regulated HSP33 family molecular chaperone